MQQPMSVKKPYCSPQLQVYGDIRNPTQTVTNKGNIDDAIIMTKTA